MAGPILQQGNIVGKAERKMVSLKNMSFYLDLKDYSNISSLTADIVMFGGTIETFLSKDVKCVVTSRPIVNGQSVSQSDSSSSRPSSRNRAPINVLQDSQSNIEQNRLRLNGTAVKSRAEMLLENARKTNTTKGSCDILQVANMWGVKVINVAMLTKWIKKIKSKNTTEKQLNETKKESEKRKQLGKCQRIKLVTPFIKYEDDEMKYFPQYRQLREWPVLNFDSDCDGSPFSKTVNRKTTTKADARPLQEIAAKQKMESKDLSKVKVNRRKPGYCEMCSLNYNDIYEHIETQKHKAYVSDKTNFANIDQRICLLPDLKEFVDSLVRTADISKAPLISSESKSLLASLLTTETDSEDTSSVVKPIKRKIGHDGDSEFTLPLSKKPTPLPIADENKPMRNRTPTTTSSFGYGSLCKRNAIVRKPLKTIETNTNDSNSLIVSDDIHEDYQLLAAKEKQSPPATRLLRSTTKRRSSSQSSAKECLQSSSPNNQKLNVEQSQTLTLEAPACVTPSQIEMSLNAVKYISKDNESPLKVVPNAILASVAEERSVENVSEGCRVSQTDKVALRFERSPHEKSPKIEQNHGFPFLKGITGARRALTYSHGSSPIENSVSRLQRNTETANALITTVSKCSDHKDAKKSSVPQSNVSKEILGASYDQSSKPPPRAHSVSLRLPKSDRPSVTQLKDRNSCAKPCKPRRILRRLGIKRNSTYDNEPNTDQIETYGAQIVSSETEYENTIREAFRLDDVRENPLEVEGLNITVFKDPLQPRQVTVSESSCDLLSSHSGGHSNVITCDQNASTDEIVFVSEVQTYECRDTIDDHSAYLDYVASVEGKNDTAESDDFSVRIDRSIQSSSCLEKMVCSNDLKLMTKLRLKRFKRNDCDSDWSYEVIGQ